MRSPSSPVIRSHARSETPFHVPPWAKWAATILLSLCVIGWLTFKLLLPIVASRLSKETSIREEVFGPVNAFVVHSRARDSRPSKELRATLLRNFYTPRLSLSVFPGNTFAATDSRDPEVLEGWTVGEKRPESKTTLAQGVQMLQLRRGRYVVIRVPMPDKPGLLSSAEFGARGGVAINMMHTRLRELHLTVQCVGMIHDTDHMQLMLFSPITPNIVDLE